MLGSGSSLSPTTYLFDQGSYSTFAETTSGSGTYRITPHKHCNNQWCWFALRSGQFSGKIPHFVVASADRFSEPAANENLAFWSTSLDTDSWTPFDNQTIGATDIEFYNNAPFPGGMIYVSHAPMYPWSRTARKVTEWSAADARIVDTPSTTSFVISNATARNNGDGRIAPALPFYGFVLTNPSGYTKNNMVMLAGSHPSEGQGNFQLEGAMAWLLGGSAEAEFLLDWFNIFVYPSTNPQGRWGGYFRSQPQDTTKDHNRYWDVDTLECIHAFRDAIAADTSGSIELGFDFHGSISSYRTYGMHTDNTTALVVAYRAKMQALLATYTDQLSNITESCKSYLESLGAKFTNGQEGGMNTDQSPATWKLAGQYAMRSIAAMHADGQWTNGPGVGSRDFSGTTDRIDWANVANPAGSPITISMWVNVDTRKAYQYFLMLHNAAETSGISLSMPDANGTLQLLRTGSTLLYRYSAQGVVTTGTWMHLLATHDGVFTTFSSIHLYKNGAEVSYVGGSGQNGSGEAAITGRWSIGGRLSDDTRNVDGKFAQVRVFNRVLTPAEIALEAAGQVTTTSGLVFWFKGNTDSLAAVPGGDGTADGTSEITGVGNGPSIIYP